MLSQSTHLCSTAKLVNGACWLGDHSYVNRLPSALHMICFLSSSTQCADTEWWGISYLATFKQSARSGDKLGQTLTDVRGIYFTLGLIHGCHLFRIILRRQCMSNTQLKRLLLVDGLHVMHADGAMINYQTVQLMCCIPPSDITRPIRQRNRSTINLIQSILRDTKVEATGQLIPGMINFWARIAAVGWLVVYCGINDLISPFYFRSDCRRLAWEISTESLYYSQGRLFLVKLGQTKRQTWMVKIARWRKTGINRQRAGRQYRGRSSFSFSSNRSWASCSRKSTELRSTARDILQCTSSNPRIMNMEEEQKMLQRQSGNKKEKKIVVQPFVVNFKDDT